MSELDEEDALDAAPDVLRDYGFHTCHIAQDHEEVYKILIQTGQDILERADLAPEAVDMLYLYTGTGFATGDHTLSSFTYTSHRVHKDLGLDNASTITTSEQGCSGLLTTIDMAKHRIQSTKDTTALVLAADKLETPTRDIMYNVMSDAAAGCIVTESNTNTITAYYQTTKSHYWNTPNATQELLATYFPLSERTIQNALAEHDYTKHDIDHIIPHNISVESWDILAELTGIAKEKIWLDNVSRHAHTVSTDHVINLRDMIDTGRCTDGDTSLLFTFGFGATWTCMILEH